jgi:hypothetical protein
MGQHLTLSIPFPLPSVPTPAARYTVHTGTECISNGKPVYYRASSQTYLYHCALSGAEDWYV